MRIQLITQWLSILEFHSDSYLEYNQLLEAPPVDVSDHLPTKYTTAASHHSHKTLKMEHSAFPKTMTTMNFHMVSTLKNKGHPHS
jgi:hypothetical protein